jgi:hypothetical protein
MTSIFRASGSTFCSEILVTGRRQTATASAVRTFGLGKCVIIMKLFMKI